MTNENNEHEDGCGHTDEEHAAMYGAELSGLLNQIRKIGELAAAANAADADPEIARLSEKMIAHRTEAETMLNRALDGNNDNNDVFYDPTLMAAVQLLIEKTVKLGAFDVLDLVNLAKFASVVVKLTATTASRVHGERNTLETMLAGIEIDL